MQKSNRNSYRITKDRYAIIGMTLEENPDLTFSQASDIVKRNVALNICFSEVHRPEYIQDQMSFFGYSISHQNLGGKRHIYKIYKSDTMKLVNQGYSKSWLIDECNFLLSLEATPTDSDQR